MSCKNINTKHKSYAFKHMNTHIYNMYIYMIHSIIFNLLHYSLFSSYTNEELFGLNKTIDQLAMANFVWWYGHVLVRMVKYSEGIRL